jgi:hypothetical protein
VPPWPSRPRPFSAISKSVVAESPAYVEEGATAVPHQVGRGCWQRCVSIVSGIFRHVCFKYFI